MTNDPLSISSLQAMLASLNAGTSATSGEVSSPSGDLEALDISGLLQQLESADGALDQLESRTDSLMQKIDALLDDAVMGDKLIEETEEVGEKDTDGRPIEGETSGDAPAIDSKDEQSPGTGIEALGATKKAPPKETTRW